MLLQVSQGFVYVRKTVLNTDDVFSLFISYRVIVLFCQSRRERNYLYSNSLEKCFTANLIIAQQDVTVISLLQFCRQLYNSTMRADGTRYGYVKTILLISVVLFPKYFTITKSSIHTICLLHFPIEFQHNLNYKSVYIYTYIYCYIFCCT